MSYVWDRGLPFRRRCLAFCSVACRREKISLHAGFQGGAEEILCYQHGSFSRQQPDYEYIFSFELVVVASNYAQYGLLGEMADGPMKWILSFILFDFAVYVWHYLGHRFEFLWRFHKIHHSDKSYHVTTGLRFHVFDQFLEVLVKCFCVVLFGVPASIVVVCEVVRMFFVLFHHGNFTFPGEKLVSYAIITPYLHRAHHSTLREEHDSNYGIVLSVWDIIFGTRKELVPATIGLELIEAENLVQLFSLAFLTERRLAKFLHLVPRRRS